MVHVHRLAADTAPSNFIARIDGVMGGRPVIRGTRITVASVQGRISGGDSIDDLIADYPDVARDALEAALGYETEPSRPGR